MHLGNIYKIMNNTSSAPWYYRPSNTCFLAFFCPPFPPHSIYTDRSYAVFFPSLMSIYFLNSSLGDGGWNIQITFVSRILLLYICYVLSLKSIHFPQIFALRKNGMVKLFKSQTHWTLLPKGHLSWQWA